MQKSIPHIPAGFKNTNALLEKLKREDENYWIKQGERRALKLFRLMSERVPAYKDFLKKGKIDAAKIKNFSDFKNVPTTSKDNYLRKYPLKMLCWDGKLKDKAWTISTTSGSTGEPFYFPRLAEQDWQYAIIADLYLRTNFRIDKRSTLYIVGFPMGAWIGGVFTYETIRLLAEKKGYDLSIITPGTDKEEIVKAVKKLGANFDQIIIGCYGPFLKDALDDGERAGIKWSDYNIGFIFSAEGFSEGFRDYVLKRTSFENKYRATLNHYGTVDLGTMSYETPISILARRIAIKRKRVYKNMFGDTIKLPTFTQYIPGMFNFEEINAGLICSAYSGLPLVRYDLRDLGGVKTFSEVDAIYKEQGINLSEEARKARIGETVWRLPFVYVFERSDFSISFYAFQIYPETIRRALLNRQLSRQVTGKFTMMTKFDDNQDQFIEINIELMANIRKTNMLKTRIKKLIVKQLLKESSEYRETYKSIGKRTEPTIVLWDYESEDYFKPGTKQKWVE